MTVKTEASCKAARCAPRSVTVVHLTTGDFTNARLHGFRKAELPEGALAAGGRRPVTAVLISAPLKAAIPFNQLLGGANAALGPKDSLELAVQVKYEAGWSRWFQFGGFGPAGKAASVRGHENAFGRMDTDTLTLTKKAGWLRYRVTINAAAGSRAILRLVSVTCTDTEAAYNSELAVRKPDCFKPALLKVPGISQMVQRTPHAKNICSPTSVAMILRYFGLKAGALPTAAAVFDHAGNIYGNWTLNTMYAGSRGLYAWPARFDSLEEARQYLAAGIPLAVSLTFGPGKLKKSPLKQTRGHLMVLKGFDARGRALVNDPAAPDERTVERAYDRKEFARAWLKNKYGTAYVIAPLALIPLTARAPLAELFSRPPGPAKKDKTRHIESQLLPLEHINFGAARGAWLKVTAREQPRKEKREDKDFKPYSGWIESRSASFHLLLEPDAVVRVKKAPLEDGPVSELSIGARVRILWREKKSSVRVLLPGGTTALISEKYLNLLPVRIKGMELRKKILETARQFLGDKYYWGGRSGYGTDCSGLVNLAYRVWGIDLPRNASDQCVCGRAATGRLKPADLIFSTSRKDLTKVNHVMLYSGGERLLEATQDSWSVREVTFRHKFGLDLAKIRNGSVVNGRTIFFRTVIES